VGHPAVVEVVAVGAVDVSDPGLGTVESFSSQGPVEIDFPTPETRAKPDLVAFDGVTTDVPGFSPFYGTSAAAPDSAAVAALLLSKKSCLTPAQIQQTLMSSAVDIGAPGFDPVAGAGRLDALAAIQSVSVDRCASGAECDDGNACTADTCDGCTCVHAPVSCDDGNPCTVDSCDPATRCQHTSLPDGTACSDGNACNGSETCQGGNCTAGAPLVCTAPNGCSVAGCDAASGCTLTPVGGFAGVACLCDAGLGSSECSGVPLPRAVRSRFRQACQTMARAENARTARRQRVLLDRALTLFKHAEQAVHHSSLLATCGNAITSAIEDARGRAEGIGVTPAR
jgi:hypothetical protein